MGSFPSRSALDHLRRDREASFSNPGRIVLKNAFSMSLPMICQLLIRGCATGPETSAVAATS
jgi:hypothetical protein